MVPGATFNARTRTWTLSARQRRWLAAALGEQHVLALDQEAARRLGLPVEEADIARAAPWPVGKAVLNVLRAMQDGAQLTATSIGPVLITSDGTWRPVSARTWEHLFRIEAVEQDPHEKRWCLTSEGQGLLTDSQARRAANRRPIEPFRSERARREQLDLGDRAMAASPPEHPDEGYVLALRHGTPPQDELLGRLLVSGDVLELKLAGDGRAEWRRVTYRLDRTGWPGRRRKVAWLDLGRNVRFHLWRERMVLRWPEEALRTAGEGAVDATPPRRPGPAGGVRETR